MNNAVNLALLVLAALLAARGMDNARRPPELRKIEVALPGLPPELEKTSVALVSDLHADDFTRPGEVGETVARINALKPDLVVLAGDYADGPAQAIGRKLAPLEGLRARLGVVAVPGNHEYYSGYREYMALLRSLGITVLENANLRLSEGFYVAGVTDPVAPRFDEVGPDLGAALRGIPKEAFTILVSHQPRVAREAAEHGVDLQLSGHTHGGMIVGIDRIVAAFNGGFVSGAYQAGPMFLYVSRGASLWRGFPVRIGVPAEITLLTLRRK